MLLVFIGCTVTGLVVGHVIAATLRQAGVDL